MSSFSRDENLDTGVDWIVFIVGTFFINVIIFNMLIAIMGDTYDRVFDNKRRAKLKLKVSALNEFSFLFSKLPVYKYLFIISLKRREDEETGEDGEWEGKIAAIQRNITRIITERIQEFINRIKQESRKETEKIIEDAKVT